MLAQNGLIEALTVGNVGDLTKYVVSADLFIPFWWADQRLADHSDIDFGTDAPVCGLEHQQRRENLVCSSQRVTVTAALQQLCRGPRRNCTPAMCRDRFRSLPGSS